MAIKVEVWGDYALFTRPEMKVERVSSDIITPSAARGILESIFWHPGMRWQVERIHVTVMERGTGELRLVTSRDIQQRAATLLRDVRYVIEASFTMTDRATPADNPGKFQEMTRRRLRKGQAYSQPYLGCREFPCQFRPCEEIPPCPPELLGTRDLGYMLYDLDYSDPADIRPMFFRAVLHDGVLTVPAPDSEEVKR